MKKIFCPSEGKYYVSSKRREKAAEKGKDRHHMAKAMERKYLDSSILTGYQYCKVSAINRGSLLRGWIGKAVLLKGRMRRVGIVLSKN